VNFDDGAEGAISTRGAHVAGSVIRGDRCAAWTSSPDHDGLGRTEILCSEITVRDPGATTTTTAGPASSVGSSLATTTTAAASDSDYLGDNSAIWFVPCAIGGENLNVNASIESHVRRSP
jgi:hypothetical protein